MRSLIYCSLMVVATALPAYPQSLDGSITSEEQKSKASVYFYRFRSWPPSALEPLVYCDEVELARADNGRYFVIMLDAGRHTFRTEHMKKATTLELKSGQIYYFEVKHVAGFPFGRGRLILVNDKTGRDVFENLNKLKLEPLDAGKVKDRSKVMTDVNFQKSNSE